MGPWYRFAKDLSQYICQKNYQNNFVDMEEVFRLYIIGWKDGLVDFVCLLFRTKLRLFPGRFIVFVEPLNRLLDCLFHRGEFETRVQRPELGIASGLLVLVITKKNERQLYSLSAW